ncbi:hydroxysteroid 11-beta-dehydrogenase 1-like protein [Corticium candelabrum]|uniref:hydroxysteroid 11-beta-dehydrogenase 1-like protein n=1 Tax=Corticium candelabrum TaxID=121492 RepID=UPI002E274A0F|nr:hydroxysteroid 11-beta-dehydrogenase 1-like protein [Corticium candelabrum]
MSGIKIAAVVALSAYLIYTVIVDPVDYKALKGQRVVVCGASTGIGEQIAYEYSKLGARIVITARRAEVLKEVAAKCRELGAEEVYSIPLDLSLVESAERLINESVTLMRGIDILVLNHIMGYYAHWTSKSVEKLELAEKMFKVNTLSYINIATYALQHLEESGGSIVVVSSFAGKMGIPFTAPYSATKHALHGFFESLRHDLYYSKSNISVTICVLGFIDTESAIQRAGDTVKVPLLSANETAVAIIRGGALRQREVYYPRSLVLALYVKQFFPRFLDSIMRYYHDENAIMNR